MVAFAAFRIRFVACSQPAPVNCGMMSVSWPPESSLPSLRADVVASTRVVAPPCISPLFTSTGVVTPRPWRLITCPPKLLVSEPRAVSVTPLSPCNRPLLVRPPVVTSSVPPCTAPWLFTAPAFSVSAPPVNSLPLLVWVRSLLTVAVRPLTPVMAPSLRRLLPVSVRFFAAHSPWFVTASAFSAAAPSAVILLPAWLLRLPESVMFRPSALWITPLWSRRCAFSRMFCPCQRPALVTAPESIRSVPPVSSAPLAPLISSRGGAASSMRAMRDCGRAVSVSPCTPVTVPWLLIWFWYAVRVSPCSAPLLVNRWPSSVSAPWLSSEPLLASSFAVTVAEPWLNSEPLLVSVPCVCAPRLPRLINVPQCVQLSASTLTCWPCSVPPVLSVPALSERLPPLSVRGRSRPW